MSRPKTKKPIIPEPSPRFALWSVIVGILFIFGALVVEYSVGDAKTHNGGAPTHVVKYQNQKD